MEKIRSTLNKAILGVSCFEHNSAASLLVNGRIVFAIEEEKLIRIKGYSGFPHFAVNLCLLKAKELGREIDAIGIGYDSRQCPSGQKVALKSWIEKEINKIPYFCGKLFHIFYINHLFAHTASSYFAYNLKDAAFLSVDYLGEKDTVLAGSISGENISPLLSIKFPTSLGIFYSLFTQYLGFKAKRDEYKVMGLAAYGKHVFIDKIRSLLDFKNNGTIELIRDYFEINRDCAIPVSFSGKFYEIFGEPRKNCEAISEKHKNIASSLQLVMEEALIHILKYLRTNVKSDNLCYSGEVSLNCALNTAIANSGIFKNIYLNPAGSDSGAAIGACFYVDRVINKNESQSKINSFYLGPSFSNSEIKGKLDQEKFLCDELTRQELLNLCALDIASGKIVGWFQGALEWGARALGNRSILADARNKNMVDKINKKIKLRESFRPFAPSVLREYTKDYFEYEEGINNSYMLYLVKAKEKAVKYVPAIVHVDGTSRIQEVGYLQNPLYYDLINTFRKITGIPLILNTSFNGKDEPIVVSPVDAIRCFEEIELDVLYLGNFRVIKNPKLFNEAATFQARSAPESCVADPFDYAQGRP